MVMISDQLAICALSIVSACFAEFISWLLIYRTEEYKKLKRNIERISKTLEKKKAELGFADNQKKAEKKVARLEEDLAEASRDLTLGKMKSMFFLSFSMMAVLSSMNSSYEGIVVAKLPFVPLSFFHSLTHRNLEGEDFTDCSGIFVYILCSMSVRTNIQKLFGFEPPKGASQSMFPVPPHDKYQ